MRIVVSENEAGMRVDTLVARTLPHGSRRQAAEAIAAGQIRINERRCRKGAFAATGDVIDIAESAAAPPTVIPNSNLPVTVLYEDQALIAIDKPAGMPSYPLRADEINTAANFLMAYDARQAGVATALEAGLVHRLDTDTSGVLLAARTADAYAELRRQFRERSILKRYTALVQGIIEQGGEIVIPLEPSGKNSQRMRPARTPNDGRAALTIYRPLRRFAAHTLLEVEIVTGVMHQIRAHLGAIGHPVAADGLYGGLPLGGLTRHFLHATRLGIQHPLTHRALEINSPLPAELEAVLRSLEQVS